MTKAPIFTVPDFYQAFIAWSYQVPMLSREREVELVKSMQSGGLLGRRSRDELLAAHMKFVVSIARKSFKGGLPLEDLIQEGHIGLLQAVERFELDKGTRFATYAFWWVREAIAIHVKKHSAMIPLSPNRAREVRRLNLAMEALTTRGVIPTDAAVARELGISVTEVRELALDSLSVCSLDIPVGEDGETTLGDLIPDSEALNAEEALLSADSVEIVRRALDTLGVRERDVVIRRRGLLDHDEETLEDLAVKYSVSRERIRQIQVKGEKLLKKALQNLRAV